MMKPFPVSQFTLVAVISLLVLTAATSSLAQEPQEDSRAVRTREFLGLGRMPDAKMAADGARIFGPTCGFCHGADARGGTAPDLLRSSVVLDDNQGELIGQTVHDGRPSKGMPAFPSLTSEQLRDIAEFLHLQVELAANRGTYKALDVVTGDAKAGEVYFNGTGKCNTCHSTTVDLAHIGSKMNPEASRRFLCFALRRAEQLPFHPFREGRHGASRGQTALPSPNVG
jgi:cytochrome c oxidase cbb3-type subunit 3